MICHAVSRPAPPGEKCCGRQRDEREHAPEPVAVTGCAVVGGTVLLGGDREHHVVGGLSRRSGPAVGTGDASRHTTATMKSTRFTPRSGAGPV